MATTSTLNTINVFDSESSYEANKGNIGENEINLVRMEYDNVLSKAFSAPDDGTRENAASGYQLFSNGFQIVWGFCTDSGTATFARPFKSIPFVQVSCAPYSDDGNMSKRRQCPDTITTTGFTIVRTGNYSRFIAFGRGA